MTKPTTEAGKRLLIKYGLPVEADAEVAAVEAEAQRGSGMNEPPMQPCCADAHGTPVPCQHPMTLREQVEALPGWHFHDAVERQAVLDLIEAHTCIAQAAIAALEKVAAEVELWRHDEWCGVVLNDGPCHCYRAAALSVIGAGRPKP